MGDRDAMETNIQPGNRTVIVMIHGLYLGGWCMSWLACKLRAPDIDTYLFSYPTLRMSATENADALHLFLERLKGERVHLVAHSLGGLVVRHLFQRHPEQRSGRVVTLGTPHNGSHVARQLNASAVTRFMLGRSGDEALLGGAPAWAASRELGSLAGDAPMGLGRLVPGLARPNDGAVAVSETRLEGAADHVTLPVTHTGMLLSKDVALQIKRFLEHGRFGH